MENGPEKTIEEHSSETSILEEENGIIEETTIKEHEAAVEEGESIMMMNEEETTAIDFSSADEPKEENDLVASDHPLIAQFRALEKNARIERAIVPIDSLIGSFSLTEKLQFINGLFGGSSEAFASATKQLNDQPNMNAAILELITIAETNSWDFARSAETIDEFMAKLCRRYANNPSSSGGKSSITAITPINYAHRVFTAGGMLMLAIQLPQNLLRKILKPLA